MTDQAATSSDKSTVHSLAKGFRVLEAFTAEQTEMGLAEVARAAGLDNGSAFRFLNTLVRLGYLEKVPETQRIAIQRPTAPQQKPGKTRFRLTLKCLDLGFSAIARSDLRTLARPLLRGLVGDTIEAASIAVCDGAEIVYVERVQAGLARLGIEVRIGSRAPVYSTAVGQVILAHLPRDRQIALLDAVPRRKLTPSTLVSLDALLERLADIRTKGFALSDQENVAGLRVLAAPILDSDGVPLAALSVSAPAFAMPLKAFEKAARAPVLEAAKTLSRALQAAGGVASPALARTAR